MTMRKIAVVVASVVLVGAQSNMAGAQSTEDVLVRRFNTQGQTDELNGYRWYEPTEAIAGAHDNFFVILRDLGYGQGSA